MATPPPPRPETPHPDDTSLDPDDWDAFRTLAHRMLDDSLDHIAGRREQPVWQPMPDAVRAAFDGPLPRAPEGLEAAYDDFRRTVVPYSMGNDHPRFWGWYMGPGNPVGNLADLLASVLNPNLGGADHAPVLVEQQVVRWCAEAAGYPTSASGLLVSGASEANLVGLAVARTARIGPEVRAERHPRRAPVRGLRLQRGAQLPPQVGRAARAWASPRCASCRCATTSPWMSTPSPPPWRPTGPRASSRSPWWPRWARSTPARSTTSPAIADLAERERLWLHVDGAIGGFLALSSHPDAVRGLERADSLALDLHKWMQAPIDVGLALVRDEAAHRATFSVVPQYLAALHARAGRRRGVVQRVRHRAVAGVPGAAGVAGPQGLRRRRVRPGHGPQHRPGARPRRPGRRAPRPRAPRPGRLRRGVPALRPTRRARRSGSTRSTPSWCCASTRAGWRSSATPCSTGRWRCGWPSATTAPATATSSCSSTPCSTWVPGWSTTSRPA